MEESCFFRVSLYDRLFGRVLSLSSRDRAHAARAPPFGRREQRGPGLGHRTDLRRESGLRRRDFLYSELKRKIERRDNLFLGGRTHLGLSVVVCGQGWSLCNSDGRIQGGSQVVIPAKLKKIGVWKRI